MRSALLPLALPAVAQAIDVAQNLATVNDNRAVELPGLLKFPVEGIHSKSISKRQDSTGLESRDKGLFYLIELTLGTPGDKVKVIFDTGSAELWVNPDCSRSTDPAKCSQYPRFEKSSTAQNLDATANLTYGTGYAYINYINDYVSVGAARIPQQIFGVASESEFLQTGILGAGPSLQGFESPYEYTIDSLKKYEFIKSRAFGVDLQGIDSPRGSVVFGGVDTKKFKGVLEARPIIPAASSPDGYSRYWIDVDGITAGKGQSSGPFAAFVDTGATISHLPPNVVKGLLQSFPGARLLETGEYLVDCSYKKSKETVNFEFGETTVKVAYNDFIYNTPDGEYCILGFAVGSDNTYSLGDSFLRGAYVVFDMDNLSLHIAQAADCGTNLVAIGPEAVGALEGECGKPTTTTTTTTTTSEPPVTTTTTDGETTTTTSEGEGTTTTTTGPITTGTGGQTSTTTTGIWNTTTSAEPTYTSTFTTTKVHTVTSCAPTVTHCPARETTETIIMTTTWCPGDSEHPKTTEAPATTTSINNNPPCPTSTRTFTLTPGHCHGEKGCNGVTTTKTVIVHPAPQTSQATGPVCFNCPGGSQPTAGITTISKPCETCGPAVPTGTGVPVSPPPPCETCTQSPPVTAGAADNFRGVGIVAAVAVIALL